MNILITGGTGFIGGYLSTRLHAQNHTITILSRRPQNVGSHYRAVQSLDEIQASEKIDGIINLAGAPIDKRWTASYKKVLRTSRIQTTHNIIALIEKLETKPAFLMNASAIGYYGPHTFDTKITENAVPVPCFTHDLCKAWEDEALQAKRLGVRVCLLRFGVVLGSGGMLKKLYWPYKCFMGGRIGDGNQGFSWIHIDDLCQAILYLIGHCDTNGPYNLTAPESTSQAAFARALATALHRPAFAHLPALVVKILFGEMGRELLLKGAMVYPQKLCEAGFSFQYPTLASALENLFPKTASKTPG